MDTFNLIAGIASIASMDTFNSIAGIASIASLVLSIITLNKVAKIKVNIDQSKRVNQENKARDLKESTQQNVGGSYHA